MPGFSIATLNVRAGGFTNYSDSEDVPPRLNQIKEAVAATGASVMGLIDTFRWRELYTAADLRGLFGYTNAFHVDMDCEVVVPKIGLCLLASDCLVDATTVRTHDCNCIRAQLQVDGTLIWLYVAYLTSFSGQRRRQQMEALLQDVDTRPEVPTLIMGDLNTLRPERLVWPAKLLGRAKRSLLPSCQFGPFTELAELLDTDAIKALRARGFSDEMVERPLPTFHRSIWGTDVGFAVDHCFSRGIKPRECTVLHGDVYTRASDHYPVKAIF